MFGDSDLPVVFADFGVPVTWNGIVVPGILDVYVDVFQHAGGPGAFQATEYLLRIPRPALSATPQPKDSITIPASPNLPPQMTPGTYTVRDLPKSSDASIVELILKGPAPA